MEQTLIYCDTNKYKQQNVLTCTVFFFQAEDGIRYLIVTGVQTCAFFFSSRRRHTRSDRDWSSDVCSSDLSRRRHKRSEEHTSELQSRSDLVCRLLLGSEEHTSELQSRSAFVFRLLLENKSHILLDKNRQV